MTDFTKLRIAVLATHGFEESELTEPVRAAKQAGARVDILAPDSAREFEASPGRIQGFRGIEKTISVPVDGYLRNDMAKAEYYDGLILPGGVINSDLMRAEPDVIRFVQEIQEAEKTIAAICHAPWILISAGLVRGRRLTSVPNIRDDIKNAGGAWVDEASVMDKNWVTSRTPVDLPFFNRDMIELFSRPIPLMSEELRAIAARSRIA